MWAYLRTPGLSREKAVGADETPSTKHSDLLESAAQRGTLFEFHRRHRELTQTIYTRKLELMYGVHNTRV